MKSFDRFLFGPCDTRVVAILRIGFGLLLVVYWLQLLLDSYPWFADTGPLKASTAQRLSPLYHESLLYYLPFQAEIAQGLIVVMMIQSGLLALGVASRVQVACLFVGLVTLQHRNLMITDGEDFVFRLLAFYFIFMPLDSRWSLMNRWLRKKARPTVCHAWGLRLVQAQMCVIFFSAAACKWEGIEWREGTALITATESLDYFGRLIDAESIRSFPGTARWLTWSVLAIEFLVPILIWWPRVRRGAMLTAIGLHIAIELTMNVFLFQWVMMLGWLSFLEFPTADDRCLDSTDDQTPATSAAL